MTLSNESKMLIGILGGSVALIVIAVIFFSKPVPVLERAALIPQGTPTIGNDAAKVFLVEFSDFQCPACKAAQPYVDEVIKEYKDSMVFAYRHFPLDQHPFGQKAAEAAEAAKAQGRFWEMYALLFANQDKLSDEYINAAARELGLDMPAFEAALTSGAHRQRVLDDKAYGTTIGVAATPTFFLNGKKLDLASFADIKTEVKTVLGK